MSHQNLFLIVPPRPRDEAPGPRRPRDPTLALLNMLFAATLVHGILLLISWTIFLYAPLGVRIVIVAAWIGYATLAVTFVKSALKRQS